MDPDEVRASALARLRTRIADLERSARRTAAPAALWPGATAVAGVLHEVRAGDYRDAPAAAGFALALALRLAATRPGALALIEARTGEGGALSARGLLAFGADPARALVIRPRNEDAALWAAEEAARAPGVAAVLYFARGASRRLTLAATRRLHLAAETSGATPMIVRTLNIGAAAPPTAAVMRWRIAPALSAPMAFDARAAGFARWRIAVEKAAAGARLAAGAENFLVEWRHDEKCFALADAAKPADSRARLPAPCERPSPALFSIDAARTARAS